METNDLSSEETAEGLVIMGLMKSDPEKALEMLEPHYNRLREMLGKALPPDLQKQVDEGYVTEELARETAQLRRQAEAANFTMETQERSRQQQAQAQALTVVKQSVERWEAQVRSTDPDYAKKEPFVKDQVRILVVQRGRPKTEAEAVQMAQEALQIVNGRMGALLPRPAATHQSPRHGSSSQSNAAPVPKTLAEAVRFAAGHTS